MPQMLPLARAGGMEQRAPSTTLPRCLALAAAYRAHTHTHTPHRRGRGGGGGNGDGDNDSRLYSHMQVPASFAIRSTGTSVSLRLRRNNCRLRKTGWEHATQKPHPSPASLRHSIAPLPTPIQPSHHLLLLLPLPCKTRSIAMRLPSTSVCKHVHQPPMQKKKKSTQPSDKPPALSEGRERGLLWQIAACHPTQDKTHRMLPITPHINSWESNL